jgi:hypothetical protein
MQSANYNLRNSLFSFIVTLSPGRLCCNGKNAVIPTKVGIQVFEFVDVYKCLDARLRGHDGLRYRLSMGEGKGGGDIISV